MKIRYWILLGMLFALIVTGWLIWNIIAPVQHESKAGSDVGPVLGMGARLSHPPAEGDGDTSLGRFSLASDQADERVIPS